MQIPVMIMFIIESGINIFQPKCINWSYLNLGIVHLIHIKKKMKKHIFANKTKIPRTFARLTPQFSTAQLIPG